MSGFIPFCAYCDQGRLFDIGQCRCRDVFVHVEGVYKHDEWRKVWDGGDHFARVAERISRDVFKRECFDETEEAEFYIQVRFRHENPKRFKVDYIPPQEEGEFDANEVEHEKYKKRA